MQRDASRGAGALSQMTSRARVLGLLAWVLSGCHVGADVAREPRLWTEPVTGIEFVLVQPGTFKMGLQHPPSDFREAPVHRVRLTKPFYLGRFEVTQEQWRRLMDTVPSQFADCGDRCPVETVSWLDVQRFITRLNARDSTGRFRLPTEAEWEYACRAGSTSRYGGGIDSLRPGLANYDPRIPFDGRTDTAFVGHPQPVGSYAPNSWDLFDLAGNVWEWTADEYCPYSRGRSVDPVGKCGSDTIAIRGGSWAFSANAARCGRRYTHDREDSGYSLGFRLVRDIRETLPRRSVGVRTTRVPVPWSAALTHPGREQ